MICLKRVIGFVKSEAVLVIACALAVVSAFFVPPDKEYLGYIDFRTLGILFCLMAVVAGFRRLGVFDVLAQALLKKVKNVRQLAAVLMLMCFFLSMLITNDVALLTFVPFTFVLLEMTGEQTERRWLISAVAMQTIAANLGSMLTPLGNPQNLYLYGKSGINLGEFLLLMLPYSALSLLLLVAWCFVKDAKGTASLSVSFPEPARISGKKRLVMYAALFVVCLLAVLHVIHWGIALAAVLVFVAAADRKTLLSVDYSLLLTFVGFFVFIGNMGRIPAFRSFLEAVVSGNEVITALLSSQVISNVPAALLLSEFSADCPALIVGTNLGGLGTLIASMASLISFKQLAAKYPEKKSRYLLVFTVSNIAFLAALLLLRVLLNGAL